MPKKYNRTIRLHVQYDGAQYSGWQRQSNQISIQETLEKALSFVANEKVTLFCAGRTDAGVHARNQVVSFSTLKSRTPLRAFVGGANALLPKDIRIHQAVEEKLGFLATTSAKTKIYRYFFVHASIENVFFRNHVWQIRFPMQVSDMKKCLTSLVGRHDFSCFQTHGKETKTSIRTIHRATIRQTKEKIYYLEIEADGFLRHMVRSIMGTLVDVGTGKIPVSQFKKIIQSKKRTLAGQTAPSHGLFLWNVKLK